MQCNQSRNAQGINAGKEADAANHAGIVDATIAANHATTKTKLKTTVLIARFINAVSLIQQCHTRNVIGTQNASDIVSVGSVMRWKSCSNLATSFQLKWEDIQTIVTMNDGVRICQLTRDGR